MLILEIILLAFVNSPATRDSGFVVKYPIGTQNLDTVPCISVVVTFLWVVWGVASAALNDPRHISRPKVCISHFP